MKILTPAEVQIAVEQMRRRGARVLPMVRAPGTLASIPGRPGLGDYSEDDINVGNDSFYSEATVFGQNAPPDAMMLQASTIQADGSIGPPAVGYINHNISAITPFVISQASTLILNQNRRRTMLVVQNTDAALTLYFSLGVGASVNSSIVLPAGAGFVFDSVCPSDSVNALFSGPNGTGVVLEVTYSS